VYVPGFGTNEAGAEFGQGSYPGELGTHYIWPDLGTIATLKNEGMNIFRVAFSMERLVPTSITGPVADAYMNDLKRVCFVCGPFRNLVEEKAVGWIGLLMRNEMTDCQWNHGSRGICGP
jgi:hypothetical protein